MISGEPIQTKPDDELAEDIRDAIDSELEQPISVSTPPEPVEAETLEDDAWMDACRKEIDPESTDEKESLAADNATTSAEHDDLEPLHHTSDVSEPTADGTDYDDRGMAIEKTGDDAMSKFGHAIGALAKSEDDLDDQALEFAAKMAKPSSTRDEAVAPHIAAAERELERSKSSGPVDIFDRIAQAAESQFDVTRGSTTKRVSELVDDRRVGTKKWTPSKTMKQRMEKLEAARVAASGGTAAVAASTTADVETPVVEEPVADAAPIAASAPTSSTATIVQPKADKKPEVIPMAAPAPMTEEQKVTISRKDRQADAEEAMETESEGASDVIADEDELDADGLRVVPGARGRRRDRARKSRLDEDFEKIFDDEGKPSINSLRRKLRSAPSEEAAAEQAAAAAKGGVTEEHFGATAAETPKKGLFSRFLKKKDKTQIADLADAETDELVPEFEADTVSDLTDSFDVEDGAEDDWQTTVDNERKQKQIAMPIIGAGAFIALGGVGYFAYKFFLG